ncbi:MAG: PqqD family protein [Deltaproteobacteria bacterium]|nr:PqqD family protein [Deltaproteobacteria bacterium]
MNQNPKKAEDCAFNRVAGETVVVKATDGTVTVLNRLGGEIWDLCDGATSLDDIIHTLGQAYDQPAETIREEVGRFMDSMLEKGIITR